MRGLACQLVSCVADMHRMVLIAMDITLVSDQNRPGVSQCSDGSAHSIDGPSVRGFCHALAAPSNGDERV